MRLHAEAEDAQSFFEIVVPHRRVPLARSAFEHFGAPDVVHEDVDVAVRPANVIGESANLAGIEVIDAHGDAGAAEARDEFCSVFDPLGTVVVRSR